MDELVKRLWECASGECFNCSQYTETTNASVCSKELMKQAADAIEELQKRVPSVPHGRLIDADKMEESIKMQSSYIKLIGGDIAKIAETLEKGALQEIANAPTVLEAEEGK